MELTKKLIKDRLRQVIDPELGINIVDLGLIYDIEISPSSMLPSSRGLRPRSRRAQLRGSGVPADFSVEKSGLVRKGHKVKILMTLTTPGCPLAAVFQPMVRQALADIPGFDQYKDLILELTFDPPWHQGMMSERARAEMGL